MQLQKRAEAQPRPSTGNQTLTKSDQAEANLIAVAANDHNKKQMTGSSMQLGSSS
jgi:hypothetical protein